MRLQLFEVYDLRAGALQGEVEPDEGECCVEDAHPDVVVGQIHDEAARPREQAANDKTYALGHA